MEGDFYGNGNGADGQESSSSQNPSVSELSQVNQAKLEPFYSSGGRKLTPPTATHRSTETGTSTATSTSTDTTIQGEYSGYGSNSTTSTDTGTITSPPASVAIYAGDGQVGDSGSALATEFSVIVKDAGGNPLSGVTVTWAIASGGGTLSAGTSVTSSLGIASTSLTLGTTQALNTATATVQGTSYSATFTAYGRFLSDNSSDTSFGFGAGTHLGTSYNGTYLTLAAAGTCNATTTNCAALSSDWTPQFASIASYWKLDGAFSDTVGSRDFSSLFGNAAATAPGKVGSGAATFDGTGDVAASGNTSFNSAGGISYFAWIKPNSAQSDIFLDKSSGASIDMRMGYRGDSDGRLQCTISDGVTTFTGTSANGSDVYHVKNGDWSHFGCVYDPSDGTLNWYVNGLLARSSVAGVAPPQTNSSIKIGAQTTAGATAFTGDIDEVAVWERALTAAEVWKIFDRQASKYSGTYTSRVFDGIETTSWDGFRWSTSLPNLKELPAGTGASRSESSSVYPALVGSTANTSDDNLIQGLLAHWPLNGTLGSIHANGSSVEDVSGNAHHGTIRDTSGSGFLETREGVFDTALFFYGNDDAFTVTGMADDVNTAEGTVAFWVRRHYLPAALDSYFFQGRLDANNQFFLWWEDATDQVAFRHTGQGVTVNSAPISAADFPAHKWHHLAISWSLSGDAVKVFLNGTQIGATTTGMSPMAGALTSFLVGGNTTNAGVIASLDEFSLWTRALHSTEIQQLYRRGANKVRFQIRTCSDSTCSTNPAFSGPGASNSAYFSEIHNNSSLTPTNQPGGSTLKSGPDLDFGAFTSSNPAANRYFQYRVILEGNDLGGASTAPEVRSVTIIRAQWCTDIAKATFDPAIE